MGKMTTKPPREESDGTTDGGLPPVQGPRRRLRLVLDGMLAVYAVRGVRTALAAVPGIVHADVSLGGAIVDHVGAWDPEALAAELRAALDPIGVGLRAVTVEQDRILPLA
jgi:hypothetical protein